MDNVQKDTIVVDVPDESRYELRLGERVIGFAAYRRRPSRIVFTHTEIEPAFEGEGFGSRLAAGALDDVRRQGLQVTPICPFIASYVNRHPEYHDLVAERFRGRAAS